MSAKAATMTADELLVLRDDGMLHELIEGELTTMTPAGSEHGRVAGRAFVLLATHINETRSFEAIGPTPNYWPEAPTFAAEVVSPGDTFAEVQAKALAWLGAGTRAVLVIDPQHRTATVYRDRGAATVHGEGDELDLRDAVPGWRLGVAELFR